MNQEEIPTNSREMVPGSTRTVYSDPFSSTFAKLRSSKLGKSRTVPYKTVAICVKLSSCLPQTWISTDVNFEAVEVEYDSAFRLLKRLKESIRNRVGRRIAEKKEKKQMCV